MGIRIMLVDDHVVVREAIKCMLEEQPDVEQVLEASDGREAVDLANENRPNVVVMDLSMPGLNGIEATRQITSNYPGIKVLALSMHSGKSFISEMLKAGASGFLVKNSNSDEMLRAVRTVASGQTYLSPQVADVVVDGFLSRALGDVSPVYARLTSREREVLQLLAEGRSTREIGERLNVSVSTVETHRRQIKLKLDIETLADLVKVAIREGLTSLDS